LDRKKVIQCWGWSGMANKRSGAGGKKNGGKNVPYTKSRMREKRKRGCIQGRGVREPNIVRVFLKKCQKKLKNKGGEKGRDRSRC